jgi:hypothetical protein
MTGLMADTLTGHHIRYHIRNAFGVIGNALHIFGYLHDQQAAMNRFGILHHEGQYFPEDLLV